jgi:hypothetical protein
MDGIDEDHRIDGVERPALPFGHALQHLVGDGGDGLPGDLGAVDLGQVGLDLAGGQALRGQRDDHLVDAGQALLPLLDDLLVRRSRRGRGARLSPPVRHRSGRSCLATPVICSQIAKRTVISAR